jgi:hypothetical protein
MKVKYLLPALISGLFFLYFCQNNNQTPSSYEKLFFQRSGGGDKQFYITTTNKHEIIFNVIRYNFKDTNYTASVYVEDNGNLSNLISQILDGQVQLKGDFKQPTNEVGTWAYIYAVKESNSRFEITNTKIRDSLMVLEKLIDNTRK